MKTRKLNNGNEIIYDDEDQIIFDNWPGTWRYTKTGGKSYVIGRKWDKDKKKCGHWYLHRLILGLVKGDKRHVDHINGNTLDNRRCNLRISTVQQNCQNRQNVKGYTWSKWNKRWYARIIHNYKQYHLGSFKTEDEARQAYLDARKKFGFRD